MTRPQVVVATSRAPAPRHRLAENQPERRRELILGRLCAAGAAVDLSEVQGDDAVLERLVSLGCVSADKLDFLRSAHAAWRAAPSPESDFASTETAEGDGLVPNFFVKERPRRSDPWARRLAWHATDVFTPIYGDLIETLADDAASCVRAVDFALEGHDVYVPCAHPGHHASADLFGGYCFVNNAVHVFRLAQRRGLTPFVVDVDYHAGDGTASFLDASEFVSLHARHDYPYVPADAPWGVVLPPGADFDAVYAPALRAALDRRPPTCDVLIVSLGFDTLADDPCAAEGHRMALVPGDFARMRNILRETRIPLIVVQEGGYHLPQIPDAAAAFWVGTPQAQ